MCISSECCCSVAPWRKKVKSGGEVFFFGLEVWFFIFSFFPTVTHENGMLDVVLHICFDCTEVVRGRTEG